MDNRTALRKTLDFAGSRNLSVFVFLMGITYVLVLFLFGLLVDIRWLNVIAGLLPYKVLYALFLLNLALFEIRWIPGVLKRCKKENLAQVAERLQAARNRIEVGTCKLPMQAFAQHLQKRGYEARIAEGVTYACKGRLSPIGNLLFHTSFFLLLFGVLAGLLYGFEGKAVVTEGHAFKGGKADYRSIAAGPAASLPDVDFDLEKISASLWEGRMFFTRLEAQLLHRGGRDIARVSSPAGIGAADVTLSGYGYAPMYVLANGTGEVLAQGYVNLNVLAPGSEDDFSVPGYPHRIFVAFYPDHVQEDGKTVTRSMSPVNPAYALRIFRGRLLVYAGVVRPGEKAEYDGMSISFPTFAKFGEFRIVSHPGLSMIWSGFALMVLGLVWRLLFYRKEVLLWQDGERRVWLTGRFDFHQKLHAGWLEEMAGELRERSG